MQLVVDGLKLQPCEPSFLEARDAILLADATSNGGANECLIWQAFAKRGMGLSAGDGGGADSLSVIEAFDVPPQCLENCGDDICDGVAGEDCETCPADCDDTDLCTDCVDGELLGCATCEACDPGFGCLVEPAPNCRQPTQPLRAMLRIRDPSQARREPRDQLTWKWIRGQETTLDDFGAPLTTDDLTLCIFDRSTPTPTLTFSAVAPAGGLCRGSSCWKLKNGRLNYRDRDRIPAGVDSIQPRAGIDGKARITWKGVGENLALPPLPLQLPALVQLQSDNGNCWEAEYFAEGVRKNDLTQFNGRAGQP